MKPTNSPYAAAQRYGRGKRVDWLRDHRAAWQDIPLRAWSSFDRTRLEAIAYDMQQAGLYSPKAGLNAIVTCLLPKMRQIQKEAA